MIPSYNNPLSLKRALDSIKLVSYRPLTIIVVDDASETNLITHEQISEIEKCGIDFNFYRFNNNVGSHLNFLRGMRMVTTKFLVLFPHDDSVLDPNYVSEGIHRMLENNCYLFVSNSSDNITYSLRISTTMDSLIDGKDYRSKLFSTYMSNHPSSILDFDELKKRNYFGVLLDEKDSEVLGLRGDDGHIGNFLLSLDSKVWVSGHVTTLKGVEEFGFSGSEYWRMNKNNVMFCVLIKLFLHLVDLKQYKASLHVAVTMIFKYPIRYWHSETINHFSSLLTVLLMIMSWIRGKYVSLRKNTSLAYRGVSSLVKEFLQKITLYKTSK